VRIRRKIEVEEDPKANLSEGAKKIGINERRDLQMRKVVFEMDFRGSGCHSQNDADFLVRLTLG